MLARLTILFVLFIALAALGPRDIFSFYAFISLAFVINIPYALWLRDERTATRSKPLQFVVDALIVTGLVHFTGGLQSELVLLYPLVIISAGIVVSGEFSLKITVLCVSLYATMIVLEMQGILKYYGPGPFPYTDAERVVQDLMLRIFVFTFFTAASSFLSDKLLSRSERSEKSVVLSSLVCDRMGPIVLCADNSGKILYVNRAASDFIGHPAGFLRGRDLSTLVSDLPVGEMPSGRPENRILTFRKTDGMSVKVPCSTVVLSSEVITESLPVPLDFTPPVVVIVGWPWLGEDGREPGGRNRADARPEFLAECRHTLLNAVASVKTSSSALLEILERMRTGDGLDSPEDRELAEGLAQALAMGSEQLQKTIEELFVGPTTTFRPAEAPDGNSSMDDA